MSTIFDVAKLAEVSIKTVSRVVNNEPNVKPATRARVQNAISQLNYAPHKGAQMMRSSKSGIVGVITGAISSARRRPFTQGLSAIHIVRGIQDKMREADKVVMIADTQGSSAELEKLMQLFAAHSVDGVIYVAEYHQQVVFPLRSDIPVVLANCFDAALTPSVVPDDEQGQYIGIQALIEKGHRKIAFIKLNEGLIATRLREEGYYNAMREGGLIDSCFARSGTLPGEGLRLEPLPDALQGAREFGATAIAFGNDLMALKARSQMAEMGWLVPDEVSTLGFDNDIAICEITSPPLSTVDLPYLEIGQQAAKRLISIWENGKNSGLEKVPCQFVERGSTRAI